MQVLLLWHNSEQCFSGEFKPQVLWLLTWATLHLRFILKHQCSCPMQKESFTTQELTLRVNIHTLSLLLTHQASSLSQLTDLNLKSNSWQKSCIAEFANFIRTVDFFLHLPFVPKCCKQLLLLGWKLSTCLLHLVPVAKRSEVQGLIACTLRLCSNPA